MLCFHAWFARQDESHACAAETLSTLDYLHGFDHNCWRWESQVCTRLLNGKEKLCSGKTAVSASTFQNNFKIQKTSGYIWRRDHRIRQYCCSTLHPLYMCCQYTARIVHYGFYCICCCLFNVKENVTPIFTLCVRQKRSPGSAYLLSEDFASLVAVCGQILSAH